MHRLQWESFAGRLADYDLINVTVEPNVVPADVVEFRLLAGEGITWWKGLLVPDGLGSSWEIWTQDAKATDSVGLWAHQVHNGQDLEFRKAKVAGVHTGAYALGGLDRLAPGSRVTFQWAQDEQPQQVAWVRSGRLYLPDWNGSFHAQVGETFQAEISLRNPSETRWTSDARYKLGSWLPPDNLTWGTSRIELPAPVCCLMSADFGFTARAPSSPGRYKFSWRMLQEGVTWFGSSVTLPYDVEVHAPPPPPAPTKGLALITLQQQGASSSIYEGTSLDPSISTEHPTPRHAVIDLVRNPTDSVMYLAHMDRAQNETAYVLLQPDSELGAPFSGLEVEGRWRAQYRGSKAPPSWLNTQVSWRIR